MAKEEKYALKPTSLAATLSGMDAISKRVGMKKDRTNVYHMYVARREIEQHNSMVRKAISALKDSKLDEAERMNLIQAANLHGLLSIGLSGALQCDLLSIDLEDDQGKKFRASIADILHDLVHGFESDPVPVLDDDGNQIKGDDGKPQMHTPEVFGLSDVVQHTGMINTSMIHLLTRIVNESCKAAGLLSDISFDEILEAKANPDKPQRTKKNVVGISIDDL